MDKDMPNLEVSNPYPIPEDLIDKELGQMFNWVPVAFTKKTESYFVNIAKKTGMPIRSVPPEYSIATVLRLTRNLAF